MFHNKHLNNYMKFCFQSFSVHKEHVFGFVGFFFCSSEFEGIKEALHYESMYIPAGFFRYQNVHGFF